MKRHPDLSQRTPQALGHERAAVTLEKLEAWFKGVTEFLKAEVTDYEAMMNDPSRIFNADETGHPLSTKTGVVLAEKGVKNVYQVTSSDKTQITVMACLNAAGDYLPPMILYPGQRMRDVGQEGFEEALYAMTDNGWMTSEAFLSFLLEFNEFVTNKKITKPVILFVDMHSTHVSLEASQYCVSNGIVLHSLLPNATHILQPADVGLFSPLKVVWKSESMKWRKEHSGESITKKSFSTVFKRCWEKVATVPKAISAFRSCGLFPFTVEGIPKNKLGPSKVASSDVNPSVAITASHPRPQARPTVSATTATDAARPTTAPQPQAPPTTSVTTAADAARPTVLTIAAPAALKAANIFTVEVHAPGQSTSTADADSVHGPSSRPRRHPQPCVAYCADDEIQVLPAEPARRSSGPQPCVAYDADDEIQVLPAEPARKSSGKLAPAFAKLAPKVGRKEANKTKRVRSQPELPKALSGTRAIALLKERAEKKRNEEEAKKTRKDEREKRAAEKKIEKEKKQREKEEKQKQKTNDGKRKRGKGKAQARKKRKEQDSETDTDQPEPAYEESDDAASISADKCAKCGDVDTGDDPASWVGCTRCTRWYHKWCTGDPILASLETDELDDYPFECDLC